MSRGGGTGSAGNAALSAAVMLALIALPRVVEACAVCFGDPDSPHTQGMNNAILVLLAIIGGVLASLAGFFLCLMRRSRFAARGAGDIAGAGFRRRGVHASAKNNGASF